MSSMTDDEKISKISSRRSRSRGGRKRRASKSLNGGSMWPVMAAIFLAVAFSSCIVPNGFFAPSVRNASQAVFNVSVGTPIVQVPSAGTEVPSTGAQGPPWVLGQWFHTRPLQCFSTLSSVDTSLVSAYPLGRSSKRQRALPHLPWGWRYVHRPRVCVRKARVLARSSVL